MVHGRSHWSARTCPNLGAGGETGDTEVDGNEYVSSEGFAEAERQHKI